MKSIIAFITWDSPSWAATSKDTTGRILTAYRLLKWTAAQKPILKKEPRIIQHMLLRSNRCTVSNQLYYALLPWHITPAGSGCFYGQDKPEVHSFKPERLPISYTNREFTGEKENSSKGAAWTNTTLSLCFTALVGLWVGEPEQKAGQRPAGPVWPCHCCYGADYVPAIVAAGVCAVWQCFPPRRRVPSCCHALADFSALQLNKKNSHRWISPKFTTSVSYKKK